MRGRKTIVQLHVRSGDDRRGWDNEIRHLKTIDQLEIHILSGNG
jgi:hypothetical protein